MKSLHCILPPPCIILGTPDCEEGRGFVLVMEHSVS